MELVEPWDRAVHRGGCVGYGQFSKPQCMVQCMGHVVW